MVLASDTTSSLLLSSLRLLDIVSPDITSLTLQIISAESTLYSLFHALSPQETAKLKMKAFASCWPIYDPLQAKEFRVVAFKWLSDLKAKGSLGSTIVRKSLLDERQGERYELLLLSLSSFILRRSLPPDGIPVSRQLVLSTSPDLEALRIQCLLHSYQLSRDVRRRKQIYRETQSFAALLRKKDQMLSEKERARNPDLDIDLTILHCRAEESRWERNWPTIKNEWIVDSVRTSLSPTPPRDFFTQSYQEAFVKNHTPPPTKQTQTIIQASSTLSQNNIANLQAMEKDLSDEITRLEATVTVTVTTPTPRKSSSRRSLPPTPNITPSSSPDRSRTNGHNLRFMRSSSRLSRSSSESPQSSRAVSIDHLKTLESLKSALDELESQNGASQSIRDETTAKKVEKSAIPRRQVSVS